MFLPPVGRNDESGFANVKNILNVYYLLDYLQRRLDFERMYVLYLWEFL